MIHGARHLSVPFNNQLRLPALYLDETPGSVDPTVSLLDIIAQ
jgi:hypothetical protein